MGRIRSGIPPQAFNASARNADKENGSTRLELAWKYHAGPMLVVGVADRTNPIRVSDFFDGR
jgi:hypothetical protein